MLRKIYLYFYRFFIGIFFGMRKADNLIMTDEVTTKNTINESVNSLGDYLGTLQKGEFNAEYVKNYYEILKKADDYIFKTSSKEKNEDFGKYGIGGFDTVTQKEVALVYDFKDTHNYLERYKNMTLEEMLVKQKEERNLIKDGLEVEHFFTNEEYILNGEDTLIFTKPSDESEFFGKKLEVEDNDTDKDEFGNIIEKNILYKDVVIDMDKPIEKVYSFNSLYEENVEYPIHCLSKSVIIKNTNDGKKQFDFYFENIILKPTFKEFNDIIKMKEFIYTTKYGEYYHYKIDNFIDFRVMNKKTVLIFKGYLHKFVKPEENLRKLRIS